MIRNIGVLGTQSPLKLFAEWTDRIAAGALPTSQPERPQGIERNVVVTMWDWGKPKMYLHDEISTDRRDPTVNANGLIFGSTELSTDYVPFLDPVRHVAIEGEDSGARPKDSVVDHRRDGAVTVLGRRADLGQPDAARTIRCTTTRAGCGSRRRIRRRADAGLLPEGIGPSFGEGVPGDAVGPPACDVRPEDTEMDAGRYLRADAPPQLRRRRQSHALSERWHHRQRSVRLGEHQDA